MTVQRLKKFLDDEGVRYVTISHSTAYTAQEIAAVSHIPGKELAKTVMVKLDDTMAMAVLPASYRINTGQLAETAGCAKVEIAKESEFEDLFPNCELGAMPPFGNLWDLDVYVAESLAEDEQIAFNAGDHTEVMRLAYAEFERLVAPKMLKFSEHL